MSFPFRLVFGLMALTFLFAMAAPASPSLAVGTFDFGPHEVGTTATTTVPLPLQGSLSDLPSDAVVYSGGDFAIDLLLAQSGVSTPVTVGAFISAFGDMTFSYEITGVSLALGSQFSADASGCVGAVSSCNVTVSFTPTTVGPQTDTATLSIANLIVTGSSLGDFATAFAPFVVDLLGGFLGVSLDGQGTPVSEGGVVLLVSALGPAPCILLSESTLDFGILPFNSPGASVTGVQPMTVSNCGQDAESIQAKGTDAAGDQQPPAVWSLVDAGTNPCDVGVDKYGLIVDDQLIAGDEFHVTTSNQFFATAAPSGRGSFNVTYQLPCQGSAGAGQIMSSSLTVTATVP